MKRNSQNSLFLPISILLAFVLWTVLICLVDVRKIGPSGSSVGLATLNEFIFKLTGVHLKLYNITDWLGLVPIGVAFCFALMGLCQWIKRKSIRKVDYSLLILGGYYIVVIALYLFFEKVAINYRPVFINGCLEASYPSSTTLLVMCVMPTAVLQLNERIEHKTLKLCINAVITIFAVFMVAGRLISGVHWFTDIIGGLLLSCGLVMTYKCVLNK